MDAQATDGPFELLTQIDRLTRSAVAGEIDQTSFLREIELVVGRLGAASPKVLDDIGPYLPASAAVVDLAIDHVRQSHQTLAAGGYRAFDQAIGAAVRRAHLPLGVAETAAPLERAGLLPPGWQPSATPPRVEPYKSVIPGDFLDEADDNLASQFAPRIPHRPRMTRRTVPAGQRIPWWAPMQLLGLGWVVVVAIIGGVLAGMWLDNRLGIGPFGLIACVLVGATAAYWSARSLIRNVFNREK